MTPRTLAAVLAKPLDESKQRLGHELRPAERLALARAMLLDVLAAVGRASSVHAVAVVTPEGETEQLALREGSAVVREATPAGQSVAGKLAIAAAQAAGFERLLLLAADIPLLEPAELDGALRRAAESGSGVVILCDRHGEGTNGLVLTPPDAMVPSFGSGSLERHRMMARGRRCRIEQLPSLALDVDTGDDLAELTAALTQMPAGVARRTRAVVAGLPRSTRVLKT